MAEKPGGSRKNMNQVEVNAQWEEAVRKENRGRILKEAFDFNPKCLNVITEKPTNLNRLKIMEKELKEVYDDSEESKVLKGKLETVDAHFLLCELVIGGKLSLKDPQSEQNTQKKKATLSTLASRIKG